MEPTLLEDRFVVFVRDVDAPQDGFESEERELVSCPTYAEAQWVRREYASRKRKCIIRYVGPCGGGD
jgi:hypothetical protein